MTLRYEDGRPVGLDWNACYDGNYDENIWRKANDLKPKPVRRQKKSTSGLGRKSTPIEMQLEIVRLYRDEKLSLNQISAKLGCVNATVLRMLQRHGVPTRSKSEGTKLSNRWK